MAGGQSRPRIKPGQRDYFWRSEEDDRLIALRAEGISLPRIAEMLERTYSSVGGRWLKLRKRRGLPRVRGNNIADPAAHFWGRVDMSGGEQACWPWAGKAKYLSGYGVLSFNMGAGRKSYGAHRVAFFLANGRPQAPGLHVLHACDNPPCCNPAHLSEGTRSQNMRDAHARGRMANIKRPAGSAHPFAQVTEAQVAAIRRLKAGGAKRADIAAAVGITLSALDNITSGRSWKCVA